MNLPALITGDLHIDSRNLDTFDCWCKFVESFQGFKTLIIIGDLFHSPDSVKWDSLLAVFDFFERFDREVILLAGNHDQVFYRNSKATIRIFKRYASVIETPCKVGLTYWIPSLPEEDFIKCAIDYANDKLDSTVLFMHQMIHQLRLNDKVPVSSSIKLEHLSPFEWVFNGHLHKPQVIPPIVNVGTPWQHSFAEAGQQKFMWLYDGKNARAIESPIRERFIEGTFEELLKEDLKDKNVKVYLQSNDNLDIIVKMLQERGAKSWVIKPVEMRINRADASEVHASLQSYIVDFSRLQNLDPDIEELGAHFLGES
jgi:DNA repair exonuclease SbcCD nuclease subunit